MSSGSISSGAKRISLLTATCIVIANMVGTGVFTSLGFQVGGLPSGFAIMVLWLVGGVCALAGALSYGELAAALPRSGGEYHFLSKIYHPAIGFLAGWLSITVGFAAPVAAAAMAFGKYFSHVAPGLDPRWVSLGVVVLVSVVHLRGIGFGSIFQDFATTFKVLLILGLITAGVFFRGSQPITFTPIPGDWNLITGPDFAVSLVFVMYAYSGWNASTYIVGEVQDPARNVPLSLGLGTALVALLYLALNAIFLRSAPLADLKGQLDVGHVAASHIFGVAGGRLMDGLICAGLVSLISAMTWVGPRVSMTMGEDCSVLSFLARKNTQGVPAAAIVTQFIIVAVLLLTATFERVVTYIQFSLTVCSFLTVLGVIVLRFTAPDLPRPYKTWGYPITPLIFLAISLWMMVHIIRANPTESLAGAITMALGLAVYFLSPKRTTLPASPSAA